jgi:hypothetical protein
MSESNGSQRLSDAAPATSSGAKPISPKQRRANRRNAKKSTGPRTAEGKQTASRNATTHGIFSSDCVLPGESPAYFRLIKNGIFAELAPRSMLEMLLAVRVVRAEWGLLRVAAAERLAHGAIAQQMAQGSVEEVERIKRELREEELYSSGSAARSVARENLRLLRAFSARYAESKIREPEDIPAASTLAADFNRGHQGSLERLSRYGLRHEHAAARAMRELRLLRAERRKHGDPGPCPFLEDVTEILQACATEDAARAKRDDADDFDEPVEEPDKDPDDANAPPPGVPTSVGMSSASEEASSACPEMPQNATSNANVQNEPIFDAPRANDDAGKACDEDAARMAPIFVRPTPLAPRTEDAARERRS